MTKAGLETMIASLKDRCKKTMEMQLGSAGKVPVAANDSRKPVTPIIAEQIVSLTALISYVAHVSGRTEFRIERELSNHFHVPNPKCLSQDQYDQAVRFMVDQVPSHRC